MFEMLRTVALALGLTLAAPPLVADAAQNAPEKLEKLTVVLDWLVNPDHAPLVVAAEKGYFAAQGLDVELIAPADPNDPPKLVAADKADIAISYQPQLHIQVNAGLPLKRIGTLIATPLSCLVVLDRGPIKSIADLKGHRIGYSVSGFEDALLKAMLARYGIAPDQVTLVNVNYALTPSLASGQVDAVIGAYRNFELNQMDILKKPGRAFYPEEEGIPAYDELIMVANRDKLNDPRLLRFLLAVEKATLFIVNHPAAAWELFIRRHKELDDELNRRAWRDTLPRFALRPAALYKGRYKRFAQFLADQGVITVALPVSNYAVELD